MWRDYYCRSLGERPVTPKPRYEVRPTVEGYGLHQAGMRFEVFDTWNNARLAAFVEERHARMFLAVLTG